MGSRKDWTPFLFIFFPPQFILILPFLTLFPLSPLSVPFYILSCFHFSFLPSLPFHSIPFPFSFSSLHYSFIPSFSFPFLSFPFSPFPCTGLLTEVIPITSDDSIATAREIAIKEVLELYWCDGCYTLQYHTCATIPHIRYNTTHTLQYHTYVTIPHIRYNTTHSAVTNE